ncbi:site-2 protease family protein [Streptomyces sp. NBC_00285]|uniref:site-2 protease family protein n=1 Tax=Streptomyces sp. NBC_00285 TaxID=2975700 RepID=UPI002E28008A|nr:site-2 protease family protein [Streptomyces sp. NBC_00285]
MDESGGSGQPRSGTDRSAKPHAGPTAQTTDPHDNGTRATTTNTDPPTADQPATDPGSGTAPAQEPAAAKNADHGTDGPAAPTADQPATDPGSGTAPVQEPAADDNADQAPAAAAPSPPEAHGAPEAGSAPGADDDTGASPAEPAADAPDDGTRTGERTDAEQDPGRPRSDHRQPPAELRKPEEHGTADDHRTLAHSGAAPKNRPPQQPQSRGGLLMGRPFGVPVYVAPSWFLVAALITWVFGGQLDRVLPELGAARYLVALFFAVAFYASVLVHELAHTVAALRFKLPVRRIQLQFFGGVSEIEKEAETPGREFVLAFVGPLLSLVLAGLFYVALQPVEPGTVPAVLLGGLMISNLIVAVFNLLPGLPLDGGRMLRAVVWKITGRPMTGTIAAAWVGRALAVSVLIGLPLLTQSGALGTTAEDNVGMDTVMDALLAAILAAIIWTGAGNSLRVARLREHLPDLRARTLTRRAVPVETDTPLSEALRRANAAGARALVVVDAEGTPLSLVREAAIVGVPEHRRPWVAVSGLAQDLTDGMRVSAELAGEDLLDALRETPATEYLVVEESGEIYGVLSAADVERAFVKAMARPS